MTIKLVGILALLVVVALGSTTATAKHTVVSGRNLQNDATTVPGARVFAHYLPWYTSAASAGRGFEGARPREGWCGNVGDCSDLNNRQYVGPGPAVGEYSQLDRQLLRYHIFAASTAGLDGFIVNVNPTSSLQVQLLSLLADELLLLRRQGASLACQQPSDGTWAGVLRFQLAISYDDSTAASLADVEAGFRTVRDAWLRNESLAKPDATGLRPVMYSDDTGSPWAGRPLLLLWSEAQEAHFAAAAATVFPPSLSAPQWEAPILLARNARRFDDTQGNFEWMGTMSTASNLGTNWGKPYMLDFRWIMARQHEFGAADGNASTNALMMGAVYPGFNDTRVPAYWNGGNTRLIARNVAEGLTLNVTWRWQLDSPAITQTGLASQDPVTAANPAYTVRMPWLQVVTWNDWPEGTAIEPSRNSSSPRGAQHQGGIVATDLQVSLVGAVAFREQWTSWASCGTAPCRAAVPHAARLPQSSEAQLKALQVPVRWFQLVQLARQQCDDGAHSNCTHLSERVLEVEEALVCSNVTAAMARLEPASSTGSSGSSSGSGSGSGSGSSSDSDDGSGSESLASRSAAVSWAAFVAVAIAAMVVVA